MLNDIAGGCKGPAEGRGGLPKEMFTETLLGCPQEGVVHLVVPLAQWAGVG